MGKMRKEYVNGEKVIVREEADIKFAELIKTTRDQLDYALEYFTKGEG